MYLTAILMILTGISRADDPQLPMEKTGKPEVGTSLPRLLDLGSHKCIPCKKMTPILAQMKKEYRGLLDVDFIDVWKPENKERALFFKIKSIPTQIFFDTSGKELWRHVGFISKEDILKKWNELGFTFNPESP